MEQSVYNVRIDFQTKILTCMYVSDGRIDRFYRFIWFQTFLEMMIRTSELNSRLMLEDKKIRNVGVAGIGRVLCSGVCNISATILTMPYLATFTYNLHT